MNRQGDFRFVFVILVIVILLGLFSFYNFYAVDNFPAETLNSLWAMVIFIFTFFGIILISIGILSPRGQF